MSYRATGHRPLATSLLSCLLLSCLLLCCGCSPQSCSTGILSGHISGIKSLASEISSSSIDPAAKARAAEIVTLADSAASETELLRKDNEARLKEIAKLRSSQYRQIVTWSLVSFAVGFVSLFWLGQARFGLTAMCLGLAGLGVTAFLRWLDPYIPWIGIGIIVAVIGGLIWLIRRYKLGAADLVTFVQNDIKPHLLKSASEMIFGAGGLADRHQSDITKEIVQEVKSSLPAETEAA